MSGRGDLGERPLSLNEIGGNLSSQEESKPPALRLHSLDPVANSPPCSSGDTVRT